MVARPGEGPGGRPSPVDPGRWQVRRLSGSAADLHHRPWPAEAVRAAWVLTVDRPALVLGSTQPAPPPGDVEVVRRRSGGGAVLVEPDSPLWVDVFVPTGDRLWSPDVGRAFLWLGDVWAAALAAAGVEGAAVHRGPPSNDPLARTVCFAAIGTGEVAIGPAKVVGISQRRTRLCALFQCAALLRWDPVRIGNLTGIPSDQIAARAAAIPVSAPDLERAFLDELSSRV